MKRTLVAYGFNERDVGKVLKITFAPTGMKTRVVITDVNESGSVITVRNFRWGDWIPFILRKLPRFRHV